MNYLELNKKLWNARTAAHLKSDFYDVDAFVAGKEVLNSIELELLGNIRGKSLLHLQCHFGQDTIALARHGALCTGIDLSDESINAAIKLNDKTSSNCRFICSDIYELPRHLDEKFDVVFTSYGTIGWLPDIDKWASIVKHFLKPGGIFVFADFHPFIWTFDNEMEQIAYSYFYSEPIVETEQGTYADNEAEISLQSVGWNHGMAEVMQALIHQNLQLEIIREFDYSPYNALHGMVEDEPGKWRYKKHGNKVPLVYAMRMKNANL